MNDLKDNEPYVVLYAGQSFASAIGTLIQLAEPGARVTNALLIPTPMLTIELGYDEDTDWMSAALELAEAAGMTLRKVITSSHDVWVIAYGGAGWFK